MRTSTALTAAALTALLAASLAVGASRAGATGRPPGAVRSQAAAASSPAGGCAPAWKLVRTPPVATKFDLAYAAVGSPDALSTRDAWLPVTMVLAAPYTPPNPYVLRWDGRSVRKAPALPHDALTPVTGSTLNDGSFDSRSDGWALGQYQPGEATFDYLVRWHGGRWTITPPAVSPDPRATSIYLSQVAAVSPASAWAVGATYTAGVGVIEGGDPVGALIEHWNGSRWVIVPNPAPARPGTVLNALTVLSPGNIWAVGDQGEAGGKIVPLIEHFDGTRWRIVSAAAGSQPSGLVAVSATGSGDIWATGSQTRPGTKDVATALIEHWNGSRWSVAPGLPRLGNTIIGGVYAAAPGDVWATTEVAGQGVASDLLHWDGRTWTARPVPGPKQAGLSYYYQGMGGTGPDDVWASGWTYNFATGTGAPQLAHLSCG